LTGYSLFTEFTSPDCTCSFNSNNGSEQAKPAPKTRHVKRGFRSKPGPRQPYPFWHKSVALPVLFRCIYVCALIQIRMILRGACSRKYDKPRKKLGQHMKLF